MEHVFVINRDIKPHKFNLSALIVDIAENLEKKYIDQRVIFKHKPIEVYADKTMIELVLINLIDNALKYSQDDVSVVIEDNRVKIVDKGIGIQESDIKNMGNINIAATMRGKIR